MEIVAVLGPLGSGKTTFVNDLIAMHPSHRISIIVNDVGSVNVDASRMKGAHDARPLTAGCIGCSDLPAFRKIIQEIGESENVDLLIIEPTGIADGQEIRRAVEEFGLRVTCLTLMDVKHFRRNRALNTLGSQLRAADAVLLTWWSDDADLLEEVYAYVGSCAPGTPVYRRDEVSLDSFLLSIVQRPARQEQPLVFQGYASPVRVRSFLKSSPGPRPSAGGDHGVYSYSVAFRIEATYLELVTCVAPHLEHLVRAKGVIEGRSFDYVQGDLVLGAPDPRDPFGNFIFTRIIDEAAAFGGLRRVATELDHRTKKQMMRDGSEIPLADTIAAIEWQLEQYPPILTAMGMRVDCEADAAYQLAKRQGVPPELWQRTLTKFLEWRLAAARHLNRSELLRHPDRGYWLRRLGANLAWHADTYAAILSPSLLAEIAALRPAHCLLEGLLCLESLGFDDELAEQRPELVEVVIRYGRVNEALDQEFVARALRHCLRLSESQPTWLVRWQRVLDL